MYFMYVIRAEKTTLIVQNLKMSFYVWLKVQVRCLFQAHSAFRYVVMVANIRRCSRTQNEIIASKTELPVKKFNSVFLRNSVILITLSRYVTWRKGFPVYVTP